MLLNILAPSWKQDFRNVWEDSQNPINAGYNGMDRGTAGVQGGEQRVSSSIVKCRSL